MLSITGRVSATTTMSAQIAGAEVNTCSRRRRARAASAVRWGTHQGSVKFQTTRDSATSCSPEPSAYAAAISAISERQRVVKSRRCSASGTWLSPLRGTRRYCRSSSNAEQNRAADSKFPNPSIR